jgi:RNA polymerase sporulation-specific sigma factor
MSQSFFEKCKAFSDEQIIDLIRGGEYIYLGVLIERYSPLIKSLIAGAGFSSHDYDDLFQESTLALTGAIKSFDSSKASFSTFATLCINRAISDQKRSAVAQKRVPEQLITPIDEIELTDSKSPEAILIEKESFLELKDNIKLELSELEYRVLCAFLAENSYSAIAQLLGISAKSVDNTLRRIRTKLKDM